MDCPSCAGTIERRLRALDGVESIETQVTAGTVVVRYDPSRADEDALHTAIEDAGYEVAAEEDDEPPPPQAVWTSPRAVTTAVGGIVLSVGLLLHFVVPNADPTVFELLGREYFASHLLFVASAALAGTPILRSGVRSARARNLNIDVLMSVGIVASVAAHHPFEGALLAVLFSIAELLERFSMDRARDSIRRLMELSPETATVVRDPSASGSEPHSAQHEETVPVSEVVLGDLLAVRPGEKVPVDGLVRTGSSPVDQAPITGESVPVEKAPGDEVYAGTIVEGGYLEIEATSTADDSTLARIVDLVTDAERERTEREQFIDRFAAVYTPVVMVAAIALAVIPPIAFGWSWDTWFLRGLTLLVIACPCALVISTPVSVVSGITSAARNGVLIKGGRHLEAMAAVDAVAIDKTGTLTAGNLTVTDVVALSADDERSVLSVAATLERRSEHPIADAVVAYARERGVEADDAAAFEALTGRGVRAEVDGVAHYAGTPTLFERLGFDLRRTRVRTDGGLCQLPPERCERDCESLLETVLPEFERAGKTIMLVGTDDELLGVIAVADEVRPEAASAVAALQAADVPVTMLTGDNEGTARTVAAAVGVEEYHAELLPEDKLDAIRDLEARYGTVAMVGDGVNDAPALATATVGVAMGAAGTDAAIETADVALLGDDLSRLPYLVRLARRANGVIRQNVGGSLAVKAALAAGAPFGVVTVIHAVVIGDMGMSLAVTGNAMRLSGVDPEE